MQLISWLKVAPSTRLIVMASMEAAKRLPSSLWNRQLLVQTEPGLHAWYEETLPVELALLTGELLTSSLEPEGKTAAVESKCHPRADEKGRVSLQEVPWPLRQTAPEPVDAAEGGCSECGRSLKSKRLHCIQCGAVVR